MAAAASDRELVAHVVRRLGIGANPDLVASLDSVDDAIARMLDVPAEPAEPPTIEAPRTWDAIDYDVLGDRLLPWWFEVLASGEQGLVERLTWFWHDRFAVSGDKVDNPYVLWQHHRLVRAGATGNVADLLHAVALDPAMLYYLDGVANGVGASNENFGREVMELHTMGPGNYTQADVREIARAFTGWRVNEPDGDGPRFQYPGADPWAAVLDDESVDTGDKTVLGVTGPLDAAAAVDLLLDQPATARAMAAALFREIVGLDPDERTARRLGEVLARDWSALALVEEIAAHPAFVSPEAVRAKVRTPLEKLATLVQAFPLAPEASFADGVWMLQRLHYLPLHPPNPAGFPPGPALLDPARLFGSFDLVNLVVNLDDPEQAPEGDVDPLERLGLVDVSSQTRDLLDRFPRPGLRLGLAFGSPEFVLT